ncbi:hypothetical protein H2O64_07060 [Kordia sp. YSTF-M3]|uniref:TonB C-terminal domain-containing protein n=1 Tax=Kordia aestuariivivens TaxID=2759037 RepID=A0ABR7Q798_9FLAO|nr:hypothetical protein [Kordia aestuariivivens]MBC8754425.1 hypothetical protein [Kordia aestuariivivens]
MKHLFFVLTILISLQAISQTDSEKECAENVTKATIDFKNGKVLGYYDYVEIEFSTGREFESFFQTYIYSKHSIFMELFSEDYHQCYKDEMNRLIRSKYGDDIYKKTKRKAFEIYKSSTREEQSKVIDVSKYYRVTESEPKFNGNDYVVRNFLKKYFVYKGKKENEHDYEFRLVTLFINKDGHITNIESHTDKLKDGFNKSNIIKEMNALGKFVPAYLLGIPVNSQIHMDFW